ncbi:MAG: CPBP family intramembrane glutamic endopeptidase [Blautia massiliensis (ex Durand et al. 2017)]
MNKIETNRRELTVFLLVAFGVPYLMGIPLAIAQRAGQDTSIFANAQMMYPAMGVMLAYLLARRPDLPVRFYALHIAATITCLGCSLLSVFMPSESWLMYVNLVMLGASVLGWVLLLTEKKEKRAAWGLRWRGKIMAALGVCLLFFGLKLAITFLSMAMSGAEYWNAYLAYWQTFTPWYYMLILIPNFFLIFLPFFGEEYGWRYYFTPVLQQRFGKRRGVLLLGVLWGLWHLPLNLFFYSPETSLQSIAAQLIACITMGIFFTFAYELCGRNIWVPVLLHYLNNNGILVWAGTAQIGNLVYTWGDILLTAVTYGIFFLPFLAARVYRKNTAMQ